MRVVNIHERELRAGVEPVGALIDSLASPEDALWPKHAWPRMAFDRPLAVGARGGHGPIRYVVEEYSPGRLIRFRFTGPEGFDGFHGFTLTGKTSGGTVLRHTLEMTARGRARLFWPLIFRPLHDALLEDSLSTAEKSLGLPARVQRWSPWVRVLRRLAKAFG